MIKPFKDVWLRYNRLITSLDYHGYWRQARLARVKLIIILFSKYQRIDRATSYRALYIKQAREVNYCFYMFRCRKSFENILQSGGGDRGGLLGWR